MARRSLLVLAVLAAVAGDARAQVKVALYAPWSGPATADDRFALGLEIEQSVAAAGGGSASVSSFAKLVDFRRAIASGRFDLAVVDAGALGAAGRRARVVASWSSGQRWVVAGTSARKSLRGASLALQAGDATTSGETVNRLLRGELPPRYWSAVVVAPFTADARELVVRKKADVVLVPESQADGLVEIADLGRFDELVLVSIGNPPAAVLAPLQAAIRARLGGNWTTGKPSFPPPARIARMIAAPMTAARASLMSLLPRIGARTSAVDAGALWIDAHASKP